jgi:hypothetical protein
MAKIWHGIVRDNANCLHREAGGWMSPSCDGEDWERCWVQKVMSNFCDPEGRTEMEIGRGHHWCRGGS